MKTLLSFLITIPISIHAVSFPVTVDLGERGRTASRTVTFDDLNGMPLDGQSFGLDFLFAPDQFVRFWSATPSDFIGLLVFQTDAFGFPGFTIGTGYIADADGQCLHTAQRLGSAMSDHATSIVGLLPLFSGELSKPLDFYGLHYELQFPDNPQFTVTGATLQLLAGGQPGYFGIGPGTKADVVPESGSSAMLLLLAALIITFCKARPETKAP